MENEMKFFPEETLWNRTNDFQLQYKYMNWCLKEEVPGGQQASNSKGLDIFEEF
jgi:hypothetical protein